MVRAPSFSKHRLAPRGLSSFAALAAFVVFLLVGAFPRSAHAFVAPTLEGPVTDSAHVLTTAERAAIEQKIVAFRQSTGHEVAVLTVATLGGETVEDFAYKTARAWALGSEKNDDGVLLLVATSERKIRIETGKGVGGDLTDVEASRIIRERIAPQLKQSHYAAGIEAGVDGIIAKVSGLPDAPPKKAPKAKPSAARTATNVVIFLVAFGFIGGLVVFLVIASRRGGGGGGGGTFIMTDFSSGDSSGGGGSDWSSGGGGGSDFGGGGGDFGGGGSSGDY